MASSHVFARSLAKLSLLVGEPIAWHLGLQFQGQALRLHVPAQFN
jgi:hypothetical protein